MWYLFYMNNRLTLLLSAGYDLQYTHQLYSNGVLSTGSPSFPMTGSSPRHGDSSLSWCPAGQIQAHTQTRNVMPSIVEWSHLEIYEVKRIKKRSDAQRPSLFIQIITLNHCRARTHTLSLNPVVNTALYYTDRKHNFSVSSWGGDDPVSIHSSLIVFPLLIPTYILNWLRLQEPRIHQHVYL